MCIYTYIHILSIMELDSDVCFLWRIYYIYIYISISLLLYYLAKNCLNSIPEMEGQTIGIYFLEVLDTGSLRSRCQEGPVSSETSLPGLHTATFLPCARTVFPLCVYMERVSSLLAWPWCPSSWDPFLSASFSPHYLLKALSSNTMTLRTEASTYKFRRDTFSP